MTTTMKNKSPRRRAACRTGVLGLAGVVFAVAAAVAGAPEAAHAQQGRLSRGSGSLPNRLERGDRASSRPAATPSTDQKNATTTSPRDGRDNRDQESRDRSSRGDSWETFSTLSERLRDRASERRQDNHSSDDDFVRRPSVMNSGGGSVTFGGSFGAVNPRPSAAAAPTFSAPTFDLSTPRSLEAPRGTLPSSGATNENNGSLRRRDRGMITSSGAVRGAIARQSPTSATTPLPPVTILPPQLSVPARGSGLNDRRPGDPAPNVTRADAAPPRRGTLPSSNGGLIPGGWNSGGAALPRSAVTLLPPRIEAGISQPVLPRNLPRRTGRRGSATVYRGGNVYYYDYGYGYYDNYSSSYCVPPATAVSIVLPGNGAAYVFNGYGTSYYPGTTFYSPYWYYRSPTFIQRSFLITTPYPFLYGRELSDARSYGGGDEDRYFGTDTARTRGLRAALNDLARFWEENDARALRRRVSPDFAVGVFQDENYAYSLKRGDFLALSNDALDRMTTISFRFDTVRDRTDGLVNAYATHVFRVRGEPQTQTATVRYTFVYVDGDWYVSAISHTPAVVTE